jgi:putative ABC transport system substrate-binding protein
MAVLWNPATPGNALGLKEAEIAARRLGVELERVEARSPGDFDGAFAAMTRKRAGSLLILGDVLFTTYRARLADLAAQNRLPALYGDRQFVEAGGLASYGANILSNFYRAATYVDKIRKGEKPGALPIERPIKFALVINPKTAKALGLTIPQSLLLRADEVIK